MSLNEQLILLYVTLLLLVEIDLLIYLHVSTWIDLSVTAVQSGSTALSLLLDGNNQFDLLLTDVHLPDINSFMLLQESLNRELPTVCECI